MFDRHKSHRCELSEERVLREQGTYIILENIEAG